MEERSITTNQYKATDLLYLMMKRFDPDGNDLFQDDTPYTRHKGDGLMSINMT